MKIDANNLFAMMAFGTLGFAYFVYGKKQQNFLFLFSGLGLMTYSYFTPDAMMTTVIGAGLTILPFLLKNFI